METEQDRDVQALDTRSFEASAFDHAQIMPVPAEIADRSPIKRRRAGANQAGVMQRGRDRTAGTLCRIEDRGGKQREERMHMDDIGLFIPADAPDGPVMPERPEHPSGED